MDDEIVTLHSDFTSLTEQSLPDLASRLYSAHIISVAVQKKPTMDDILSEFKSGLKFKKSLDNIQQYCKQFLEAFKDVGGSYKAASDRLRDDWIVAVKSKLDIDINFDM